MTFLKKTPATITVTGVFVSHYAFLSRFFVFVVLFDAPFYKQVVING